MKDNVRAMEDILGPDALLFFSRVSLGLPLYPGQALEGAECLEPPCCTVLHYRMGRDLGGRSIVL
jgi:hypothetical protein